ncbi:MAG: ArsR/SmtB family transcription factor [Muricoprocola sp.]
MDKFELPHQHGAHGNLPYIKEQLDQIPHFQTVADVFKQLSDTSRVRIFWLLCHCEECVINISAMLEMSSPAVSHHLKPLRSSGLIVSRRVGKEVYYRASDTKESQLLHQMIEQVMEITCPEMRGI